MTKLRYNPNNTEGHYPTSFDFVDTELRKDDKIVATDLVDLYDVDVSNVSDGDILVYDDSVQKWVPGQASAGCDTILQDTIIEINDYGSQFSTLKECFDWLRNNCKKIAENATLTILLESDQYIGEKTCLNHPYGHRIRIIGNSIDREIRKSYRADYYNTTYPVMFYAKKIYCGGAHTLAIKEDGTLWGTGNSRSGQLGSGSYYYTTIFTQIGTDTDWKNIAGGWYHTLAIKEDGTLWGTGIGGTFGTGDTTNRKVFTQIGTDTDWKSIGCGAFHSMAIKENGTLWVTGHNGNGQLGLNDTNNRLVFVQVNGDTDWKNVDCGEYYSIAVKTNGTLWGTGSNYIGQIGLGTTNHVLVFTQVGTDTNWEKTACVYESTLALKNNGTLWSTGYNSQGQLGLGNTNDRNIFTQAGTNTDWIDIGCGIQHSMAIKNNGTLWSTGHYAVTGNGSSTSFKQVGTDTDWRMVSCGVNHTVNNKNNDTLWSTGKNDRGQLGTGNINSIIYFKRVQKNIPIIMYNKDQLERQHEINMYLSGNNSLMEINSIKFRINLYVANYDPTIYNDTQDILYLFKIENDSNVVFNNVSNSFTDIAVDNFIYFSNIYCINNSYISVYNSIDFGLNLLLENSSSAYYTPYIATGEDANFILKNNCVLLTDDDSIANDCTLINSRIIEKKV